MIASTRLPGTLYDSRLHKIMDAEWALTLTLRIFLQQVNRNSFENKEKQHACQNWKLNEWLVFNREFKRIVEKIWNGKLWLKPPTSFKDFDFPADAPTRRQNVTCRLQVELTNNRSVAHHVMRVVRLSREKNGFISNSTLLTNLDMRPVVVDKLHIHVTAAHEVGHLMELDHPGDNFYCQIDPNDEICYSDFSIMGKGVSIDERHALPWREQMASHTQTLPLSWSVLKRPEPAASLFAGWY